MLKPLFVISALSLCLSTTLVIADSSRQQSTATILKHHDGKGRYDGMLGSMSVQNEAFGVFKISVGFTKATRQLPPPINTEITFSYGGITSSGFPKRPAYIGVADAAHIAN